METALLARELYNEEVVLNGASSPILAQKRHRGASRCRWHRGREGKERGKGERGEDVLARTEGKEERVTFVNGG